MIAITHLCVNGNGKQNLHIIIQGTSGQDFISPKLHFIIQESIDIYRVQIALF